MKKFWRVLQVCVSVLGFISTLPSPLWRDAYSLSGIPMVLWVVLAVGLPIPIALPFLGTALLHKHVIPRLQPASVRLQAMSFMQTMFECAVLSSLGGAACGAGMILGFACAGRFDWIGVAFLYLGVVVLAASIIGRRICFAK